MLLKWIRSTVAPEQRQAFSEAQVRWRRLAGEPGLLAQVGGWDVTSPELACIVALWRDRQAYDNFMATRHDRVAAATAQHGSYAAIDTAAGDVVLAFGDVADKAAGQVMRVADCQVLAGRVDHFVAVQEAIWVPGMQAAPGHLGGWMTRLANERFLVTTWWTDLARHAAYVAERLPELRATADVDQDIARIEGHVVVVEPSWWVT